VKISIELYAGPTLYPLCNKEAVWTSWVDIPEMSQCDTRLRISVSTLSVKGKGKFVPVLFLK